MPPAKPPAVPRLGPSLKGIRVLSLALNLPGPAALMRCRQMGARCVKLEPPTGDPMRHYSPPAHITLNHGIRVVTADLKTPEGQKVLHRELARTDVLLTSFRPSALVKLKLGWRALHRQYPLLSQVAVVGYPAKRAEEPGHDLSYMVEHGLITGLELPATLYADMGGALMAVEAVLQAALLRSSSGKGVHLEVALSNAAAWLALPRAWGLMTPGSHVAGGHAGYGVYPCKDGRVAVAALEPHFATRLCEAAGVDTFSMAKMLTPAMHQTIEDFLLTQTRRQLDRLAKVRDIPLHTLPK